MPDLCQLDDLKSWLGITLTDTSEDASLERLISATSDDFVMETDRPDLTPEADYTEYVWQRKSGHLLSFHSPLAGIYPMFSGTRHQQVWLKHYPINSIASVTINAEDVPAVTLPLDSSSTGYWFDDTAFPEDRQSIILLNQPYGFPFRVVVTYNAGYDEIPAVVSQAVIEWCSFKRGTGQIQQLDQAGGSVTIGTYTQTGDNIDMQLAAITAEIPANVARVIERYRRKVI
jgi:hypothetical protein